jgi:hypothetical protein
MAEYYVQNGGVGIQYVDMAELSSAHVMEQVCWWCIVLVFEVFDLAFFLDLLIAFLYLSQIHFVVSLSARM